MTEGPMTVSFDQQKGSLVFSSSKWEFRTDKLKKDEEYRFEISFYNKIVELDCRIEE